VYYFIEPMNDDDIEAVQAIERTCFTTSWSTSMYRRELRSPSTSRYIVARASTTPPPPRSTTHLIPYGRHRLVRTLLARFFHSSDTIPQEPVVGYGGLSLVVDEGHIMIIAVDPIYRGQGVGELLLNGLIDLAFDLHMMTLTLEVRSSNKVAQNLYLKYGFKPVGNRPRYYTDNGEDALIMTTDPIQSPVYQHRLKEVRWHLFNRLQRQAELTVRGGGEFPNLPNENQRPPIL
jgi:ribosomal-protein-alanine N-acetyltransferase